MIVKYNDKKRIQEYSYYIISYSKDISDIKIIARCKNLKIAKESLKYYSSLSDSYLKEYKILKEVLI
jgi:hypothetical protein